MTGSTKAAQRKKVSPQILYLSVTNQFKTVLAIVSSIIPHISKLR